MKNPPQRVARKSTIAIAGEGARIRTIRIGEPTAWRGESEFLRECIEVVEFLVASKKKKGSDANQSLRRIEEHIRRIAITEPGGVEEQAAKCAVYQEYARFGRKKVDILAALLESASGDAERRMF